VLLRGVGVDGNVSKHEFHARPLRDSNAKSIVENRYFFVLRDLTDRISLYYFRGRRATLAQHDFRGIRGIKCGAACATRARPKAAEAFESGIGPLLRRD